MTLSLVPPPHRGAPISRWRRSRAASLLVGGLVFLTATDALAQRRKTAPAPAPATPSDREPPGAAGELPSTMDKIAKATDVPYRPVPGGHLVKFNLQNADLGELVNHISGMTGKRFIYGAKVRKIEATVVSPAPVTLDEAYQAFLSILQVNGMTVVPHGRFLKIVDSAGITGSETPVYSRGAPVPYTDSYVTRLYRTRYVNPDEAVALLTKFKSKEGDISTYPAGNLIILTDTGTQIRRLVRILEEIDVGGAGQQMWIEPINHGDAEEMAERINELFEVKEGTGGLSKVLADVQTNSLVIVGNDESYRKLLQILSKLDARHGEAGSVHVLPLQHAVADELAKTLQQMLSGNKGGKKKARATGDAGGMFDGDVMVTPDQATNSLVVSSSPRDFAQLRLVVDRLDQPRRQVFIEAVIMDVGVSNNLDFGFSWHGGGQPDLGGGENSTVLGGFNAGQSVMFPFDANALQGFAAGVRGPGIPGTNNTLLPGVSIPAFGVVMNALAGSGRGNVLATPHIIATDNVAAEINVGENIPLQTNIGGGFSSPAMAGAAGGVAAGNLAALSGFGFNAPRQDVGNKIKVTPHINESDQVRLEIEQESSAPGTPTGQLGAIPITKRTANTTVVVKDQQTIVIGGLMRDEFTYSKDKVPILGDIPVLGFLFSSTKKTVRKTNLLLVLTPHVIREQEDLRRIFERKMQERQEFIDRYFVFTTDAWEPPRDYSRSNGLVEDIRQAFFTQDEQIRLEDDLKPRELHEHVPSEAIDLPSNVNKAGTKQRRAPPAPAPAKKGELDAPAEMTRTAQADAPTLRVPPPTRSVAPQPGL